MAITFTTELSHVYATAADSIRPELACETARSNALTAHMYRQGAVKYAGGGKYRIPVSLTDNPNVVDVGPYDTFTVAPTSDPTNAVYDQETDGATILVPFVLAKEEMARNKDKATQVLNLMQTQLSQAFVTLGARLSTELFSAKAGKALKGLPDFLEANPVGAQVGVVAGIDKALYQNWNNQFEQITTWATDGEHTMTRAIAKASMIGSSPDIIVSSLDAYLLYEEGLLPNQRDYDTALANMGFRAVAFRNIPWVIDSALDGLDEIYVLTTTGRRGPDNFNLKKEFFATPGKNPIAQALQTVAGFCLVVMPEHDYHLEGPFDAGFQQRTLNWSALWGGMLVTGSMQRQALVNYVGGVVK